MTRRRTAVATTGGAVLALLLAACGHAPGSTDPQTSSAPGFPVTIENCGAEVTFDAPPERVVMLKSWPVVYLHELGALDRVVARAGAYPAGYYDDDVVAELEEVPLLTDELDSAGHLQISKETVLAQRPDLVLGEVDNLDREALAAAGIPVLEEPALCEGTADEPSFDDVYAQMETFGRLFDEPARGRAAATALAERVDAARSAVRDAGGGTGDGQRTAAVLYPTIGGGTIFAYGTRSMAQPQLEAAGLRNVFADVDERVFEVTREELVGRDPDVLVLLHSDGDPAAVEEAVTGMAGAGTIGAVADGEVLVQLFNFTEPPSPVAVAGLERVVERFVR